MAVGLRAHLVAARANHDVRLPPRLYAAGHAARRACLSLPAIPILRRGILGRAGPDETCPSVAGSRPRRALGTGIDPRGPAQARLLPVVAAQTALDLA